MKGMKILAMWSNPKAALRFREMLEKEGIRVREMTIVEDEQYQNAVTVLSENEKALKELEEDYLFLETR